VKCSDFLWNEEDGQEIAAPHAHGTITGLHDALATHSFRLTGQWNIRGVPGVQSDLHQFIAVRHPAVPPTK
jgi:hypothetical protein